MKTAIQLIFLVALAFSGFSQEPISREVAVRIATYLNFDLSQFKETPIPTDGDTKRPVGLRLEEYGGLIVPETKLSADTFFKIGKEVVPVGQLWLRRIAPLKNDEPINEEKLRLVPVSYEGRQDKVCLCLLGARKNADGTLELLIYSKEKEPLITVPMKKIDVAQENPIEISAEVDQNTAVVTLKIVGKYEASFKVGESSY